MQHKLDNPLSNNSKKLRRQNWRCNSCQDSLEITNINVLLVLTSPGTWTYTFFQNQVSEIGCEFVNISQIFGRHKFCRFELKATHVCVLVYKFLNLCIFWRWNTLLLEFTQHSNLRTREITWNTREKTTERMSR